MTEPGDVRALLHRVADDASEWLEGIGERPIGPELGASELKVSDALADAPTPVDDVIAQLVREAEPGLTAMASPRFFGFVIGGAHPAAIAAEWLVSAWDQNAGLAGPTPAVVAIEAVAGAWVLDLLGLPAKASFAFVTGCQMAHATALAAARHRVLAAAGHDADRDGLAGAPPIRVLAGAERHVTVDRALRFLGIGTAALEEVAVDDRGAMRADALRAALGGLAAGEYGAMHTDALRAAPGGLAAGEHGAMHTDALRAAPGGLAAGEHGAMRTDALRAAHDRDRPTIVVAQVGNVNTGAIDPVGDVCAAAHEAGAWVHVDGAFGLWAAASPSRRALVRGAELADSWATDAHKWLNVPYDCGIAIVRDTAAHRAAMAVTAPYLVQDAEGPREPMDWTPEFSRRARGVAVYALLRALGRSGVAELVDRLCDCAERFATQLAATDGFEVVTQQLNQVLVRVGDDDATTLSTLAAVQADNSCWPTATTWRGRSHIRLSVCSWRTTAADVDRSVAALARAARDALGGA